MEGTAKKRRIRIAAGVVTACMAFSLCAIVACAPQTSNATNASDSSAEQSASAQSGSQGYVYMKDIVEQAKTIDPEEYEGALYDAVYQNGELNPPLISTLKDGTQVQRTPSYQGMYNQFVLGSEHRGCYSCHDNIKDELYSMPIMMYGQTGSHITCTGLDSIDKTGDIKISECISCHENGGGTGVPLPANLVHGLHSDTTAKCTDCHTTDIDGNWTMWDYDRYNELMGIYPADASEGSFSWDQTTTVDNMSDVFHFGWNHNADDAMRYVNDFSDQPLYNYTEEEMRAWEVSFTGAVEEPVTVTMGEMIDAGCSVDTAITIVCQENGTTGSMIANAKVTGVSVNKAIRTFCKTTDGYEAAFSIPDAFYPYTAETYPDESDESSVLVYKIGDSLLDYSHGWPVMHWKDGKTANQYVMRPNQFYLGSADTDMDTLVKAQNGGEFPDVAYVYLQQYETDTFNEMDHNDPNEQAANDPMGRILNFADGQIIEPGEFTFEGYAFSRHDTIAGIQVSMDLGNTWTTYPVENAKKGTWVYWKFTYDFPDAGEDSAYALYVRPVTSKGWVANWQDRVLVNVH